MPLEQLNLLSCYEYCCHGQLCVNLKAKLSNAIDLNDAFVCIGTDCDCGEAMYEHAAVVEVLQVA